MNIEVKNVKFGLRGSEGIKTWECKVYVDNKHIANANEYGDGGPVNIQAISAEGRKILNSLEAFLKEDKNDFEVVESKICDLVEEIEERKLINRRQKNELLFKNNNDSYTIHGYKWPKWNIDKLLSTEGGKKVLRDSIKEIKEKGGYILNTNIPENI